MSTGPTMAILLLTLLAGLVGGACVLLFASGRSRRPYASCGQCGYDVTGSLGVGRCPECGRAYTEVGINPPGRRRRPLLRLVAVVTLILATVLAAGMILTLAAVAARSTAEAARARAMAAQVQAQQAQQAQRPQPSSPPAAQATDSTR